MRCELTQTSIEPKTLTYYFETTHNKNKCALFYDTLQCKGNGKAFHQERYHADQVIIKNHTKNVHQYRRRPTQALRCHSREQSNSYLIIIVDSYIEPILYIEDVSTSDEN